MDVTLEYDQIHALSRDASRSTPLPTGAETSAGLRQQDDQTDRVYAKRFPVLNSDTARQSPWSGKLLLSLGEPPSFDEIIHGSSIVSNHD
jgi:hypothetical protein